MTIALERFLISETRFCSLLESAYGRVPPEDLDRLSAIRPDITARVIQGAAHCPMETHPDEFTAIVLEWLSGAE